MTLEGNVKMTATEFESRGRRTPFDASQLSGRLDASRLRLPTPFAAERVQLVASLAQLIIGRKGGVSAFITYLGFWTRLAALRQLERSFRDRLPVAALPRPRGLVFHLPPKNVETIFMYSWILSYLAGNANIVRMPQEISGEVSCVFDQLLAALDAAGERSQIFIHYPSDGEMSAFISAHSDARVVWGGDAKIAALEKMPLRNGGKSIWFGDRSSLCVLNGSAVAELDETGMTELAHRIFNDIFTFDQMACSSPQALYVVGTASHHLLSIKTLLTQVGRVAAEKGTAGAAGHQIAKMTTAFSAAAAGNVTDILWRNSELTSVISADADRVERRVGGGFLSVVFIADLEGLDGLLRERDQTITHYGFSPQDVRLAAERNLGPGVTRWTPVGSALEFDSIWDGYDILMETTRLCRVS